MVVNNDCLKEGEKTLACSLTQTINVTLLVSIISFNSRKNKAKLKDSPFLSPGLHYMACLFSKPGLLIIHKRQKDIKTWKRDAFTLCLLPFEQAAAVPRFHL